MHRDGTTRRTTGRRLLPLAAAAVVPLLVLGVAAPASAHATVTSSTTAAGASAVLVLSVEHGCEGSPTTELAVRIPDEITTVSPTADALWEVATETEPGTDRIASVTFRAATPLPDGQPVAVELAVTLPETEGAVLTFPTVQSCEQGELAWLEVPGDGLDDDDLELPAPQLVVTAADGRGTTALAGQGPGLSGTDTLTIGVVGAGVLGTAALGGVLARRRRRA